MKEIRVADVKKGNPEQNVKNGIVATFRCCDHGFHVNGRSIESEVIFFPTEEESPLKVRCQKCKQCAEISYNDKDGTYEIRLPPEIKISYIPGKFILVSGHCQCQNCCLRDCFTNNVYLEHCVECQQVGEYAWVCICNKTHVLLDRGDHFHVCEKKEQPVLSSKQSEQQ